MQGITSRVAGSLCAGKDKELPSSCSSPSSLDTTSGDGCQLLPKNSPGRVRLPTLSRFLADFTLGFADGLTVPFALTAGLSSLGETKTVLYAGMAEICAGSISSTYPTVFSILASKNIRMPRRHVPGHTRHAD